MKKILLLFMLLIFTVLTGCNNDNVISTSEPSVTIVVEPNNITSNNLNGYKDLSAKPSNHNKKDNNTSSTNPSNAQYIGNKNSKKFHISNCTYAQKMKNENAIYFNARADATSNGYTPCSKCNP